jgi:hypothetical protein
MPEVSIGLPPKWGALCLVIGPTTHYPPLHRASGSWARFSSMNSTALFAVERLRSAAVLPSAGLFRKESKQRAAGR